MLTSKTLKTSLVAFVALAAVVPPAAGHGGGVSAYRSAVTSVSPATSGLTAEIVQGDQLALTNKTGKVVVVLGYAREPYLRFRAGGGVDMNIRSPAAALDLAANADAKAAPRWLRIRTGSSHAWHDNRIRWRSHRSGGRAGRTRFAAPHLQLGRTAARGRSAGKRAGHARLRAGRAHQRVVAEPARRSGARCDRALRLHVAAIHVARPSVKSSAAPMIVSASMPKCA